MRSALAWVGQEMVYGSPWRFRDRPLRSIWAVGGALFGVTLYSVYEREDGTEARLVPFLPEFVCVPTREPTESVYDRYALVWQKAPTEGDNAPGQEGRAHYQRPTLDATSSVAWTIGHWQHPTSPIPWQWFRCNCGYYTFHSTAALDRFGARYRGLQGRAKSYRLGDGWLKIESCWAIVSPSLNVTEHRWGWRSESQSVVSLVLPRVPVAERVGKTVGIPVLWAPGSAKVWDAERGYLAYPTRRWTRWAVRWRVDRALSRLRAGEAARKVDRHDRYIYRRVCWIVGDILMGASQPGSRGALGCVDISRRVAEVLKRDYHLDHPPDQVRIRWVERALQSLVAAGRVRSIEPPPLPEDPDEVESLFASGRPLDPLFEWVGRRDHLRGK